MQQIASNSWTTSYTHIDWQLLQSVKVGVFSSMPIFRHVLNPESEESGTYVVLKLLLLQTVKSTFNNVWIHPIFIFFGLYKCDLFLITFVKPWSFNNTNLLSSTASLTKKSTFDGSWCPRVSHVQVCKGVVATVATIIAHRRVCWLLT